MLHFLAAALLGTLVLAQQPADSVSSTDLPGSVAVSTAKAKPSSEAKPASPPPFKAVAQQAPKAQAAPPPPPPPPKAAPAPDNGKRPSQRTEPNANDGKRVAAFWMMLPG